MYAEIKYDGERVQVHKQGDRFEYTNLQTSYLCDNEVQQESCVTRLVAVIIPCV